SRRHAGLGAVAGLGLLDWLRWGWTCYGSGGLWRAKSKAAEAGGAEKPSPSGTAQPSQPSDR
ncbi:hypothetical protein, partial [Methylogaea oryzae]|uniref:hypothetical protein n=1 Tax=Methylogaea oryzae TaxID=1295382 RepID=UPI001C3F1CA7